MNVPTNIPKNDFNKSLVSKFRTIIKKGDFISIIWDRNKKEFIVAR